MHCLLSSSGEQQQQQQQQQQQLSTPGQHLHTSMVWARLSPIATAVTPPCSSVIAVNANLSAALLCSDLV
jgi:hypothetical protein